MPIRIVTASLLVSSLLLAGCASKPKDLPPAPQASTNTSSGQGSSGQPAGLTPGSQADFLASVLSDTIVFDTERYNVDVEDQATLQSQAQWLSRYPGKSVLIEGHCDERGTRDFNIALGERRANAAKNYLASLGIAASRITTVSYGKERPIALGSDEASWAKNRRAVTVTVQ